VADRSPRGVAAFSLATAGVLLAGAVTWWVLTASVYAPGGETLLEVNREPMAAVAVAIPLVLSLFVWGALHIACRRGSKLAWGLGATAAGLLAFFALISGFSIGMFFLPAATALLGAAALTPR
jgi:hypothetical protein